MPRESGSPANSLPEGTHSHPLLHASVVVEPPSSSSSKHSLDSTQTSFSTSTTYPFAAPAISSAASLAPPSVHALFLLALLIDPSVLTDFFLAGSGIFTGGAAVIVVVTVAALPAYVNASASLLLPSESEEVVEQVRRDGEGCTKG